jgi:hypothetical protein
VLQFLIAHWITGKLQVTQRLIQWGCEQCEHFGNLSTCEPTKALDVSPTELNNALKQYYKSNGAFRENAMLMSAMAKVDELWARALYRL